MCDLSTPTLPTWTAQLNRAPINLIHTWMREVDGDPWRGIHAVEQRPYQRSPPHDAYLPMTTGQRVTILSPSIWSWQDQNLLTGTYVVAISTYNPSTQPLPLTDYTDPAPDDAINAPHSTTTALSSSVQVSHGLARHCTAFGVFGLSARIDAHGHTYIVR